MVLDLAKLWKDVLSDIKIEVSVGTFTALFKPTALLSLEENTATIAALSPTHINMIQKKFESLIKESLKKHIGKELSLVFVPKNVTPTQPEKQQPSTPLFPEEKQKPQPIGHLPRVRADYTFATLAVSEANKLAFVSAENVAKHLGQSYNPLFIYGPVGTGKTHLMQAIANDVYQKNPDTKIIYITSEEFTNEVVEAIRHNDTARMKRKFRSVKLLIIDDIQFIAGKEKVQEELFHTFNSLIDGGGQIVLSSDKPPSEIKKLEARLSSRFAGGLTVDVEAPDFELRTAILLKKAEKYGFELPMEVAQIIAEKEQDVRSLEGALMKIITKANSTGQPITSTMAAGTLQTIKEDRKS